MMDSYDVILFPCQGGEPATTTRPTGSPTRWTNLLNYTNDGGRIFATHYHYDLLDDQRQLHRPTANWNLNDGTWAGRTRRPNIHDFIGQTLPRGRRSPVAQPARRVRRDVRPDPRRHHPQRLLVRRRARPALDLHDANDRRAAARRDIPLHYTFDTPLAAAPRSAGASSTATSTSRDASNDPTAGEVFPAECPDAGSMTPQEKLLEFMLFDLTSCVSPPTCTPLTCAQLAAGTCGRAGDGCGRHTPTAAPAPRPQTCGGGGVAGQCGCRTPALPAADLRGSRTSSAARPATAAATS